MLCRLFLTLAAVLAVPALFINPAFSQLGLSHEQIVARENNITIKVVAGQIDDTSTRLANEMAVVLDQPEQLRILPVLSGGGSQNISDLLYLKGVDVGFVRTDVMTYVRENGAYPGSLSRLRYISKLHNEEIYVVAGAGFEKMSDLAGRSVNFGRGSNGNKATPELIFQALGIEVKPEHLDHAAAIKKIKTGELAATIIVNAKPNTLIAGLKAEDGLKLLPIEYTDNLQDMYLPSTLSSEDYPNLIAKGQSVDTLATSVAMVMYNWPKGHSRYKRVERFVKAFFTRFNEFRQAPRHPKWKEVNLTAGIPGWERFTPAETWLSLYGSTVPGERALSQLEAKFKSFLQTRLNGGEQTLTDEQRQEMFRTFLGWKENETEAAIQVHLTSQSNVGRFIGTVEARNIQITVAGIKEQALLLKPKLTNLTPGPHALHIHMNPNCGPAVKDNVMVAGLGAGGHLFAQTNGVTYGSHLGDLPDLTVAADGTATEELIVPRLTLADLLNRSIMVHASADDGSSRQACGVIN